MLTDERLVELERLANAATPGPWFGQSTGVYGDGFHLVGRAPDTSSADLEFIAAARTAVPELLTEVRRLQESLHFLQSRYDSLNLSADQYCESRDKWRMERMAYHRAVALLEPATRDLVMKWAAEDVQRYGVQEPPHDPA